MKLVLKLEVNKLHRFQVINNHDKCLDTHREANIMVSIDSFDGPIFAQDTVEKQNNINYTRQI